MWWPALSNVMISVYWPVSPTHHVDPVLIGWWSLPRQMTVHAPPAGVSQVVVPAIVSLSLILGPQVNYQLSPTINSFNSKTLIFARTCWAVGLTQTILLWDWIVSIDDWPIPYLAFHPEPWLPESGDWGHRALEQCSADQPWLTSSRLVVTGWWHLNINDD